MLRYAITGGVASRSAETLLDDARRWAALGVDYVQLREKWMAGGELVEVAAAMAEIFREGGGGTKLLINGRADVAVAAGADGVHLTSAEDELTAEDVRRVFGLGGRGAIVSVSCHGVEDVQRAVGAGADLVVFGPVFEKQVEGEVGLAGVGLEVLRRACEVAALKPVLALGGVSAENAVECIAAGAGGVAGIRLFAQQQDIRT